MFGTLTPSFLSKLVEKGKTEFNPKVHITKPVVHLTPSKKYFTLNGVSYERFAAPNKKSDEEHNIPIQDPGLTFLGNGLIAS